MTRVSPQEGLDKWTRRTKAATQDYQTGVQRVSVAPGQKAAAQANLMAQKVQESISTGRWQRAVSAVSLADWQSAALTKGAGRISAGVDGAQNKMAGVLPKLYAAVDASVAEANKTPRGDLQANITRMVTFATAMNRNAPNKSR